MREQKFGLTSFPLGHMAFLKAFSVQSGAHGNRVAPSPLLSRPNSVPLVKDVRSFQLISAPEHQMDHMASGKGPACERQGPASRASCSAGFTQWNHKLSQAPRRPGSIPGPKFRAAAARKGEQRMHCSHPSPLQQNAEVLGPRKPGGRRGDGQDRNPATPDLNAKGQLHQKPLSHTQPLLFLIRLTCEHVPKCSHHLATPLQFSQESCTN